MLECWLTSGVEVNALNREIEALDKQNRQLKDLPPHDRVRMGNEDLLSLVDSFRSMQHQWFRRTFLGTAGQSARFRG